MFLLKAFLQKIAPLPPEEWARTQSFFFRETVQKGAYYIKAGQYASKVSFIESGLFKLYYLAASRERIMMFFSENQFVTDYFGYLTHTPSVRPIQAVEDAVLYSISRDDLNRLFDASKTWEKIGRILAERAYVVSVQRANRLLHDDPDTRFATFMQEYPTLLQRVPQYMIASYLDMTPETLSRIKKRLMKAPPARGSVHDPLDPKLV